MNSCLLVKALSQVVMSALSVDPEDAEQLEVEKNISRAPFLLIFEL